jgi:hypothetical protein
MQRGRDGLVTIHRAIHHAFLLITLHRGGYDRHARARRDEIYRAQHTRHLGGDARRETRRFAGVDEISVHAARAGSAHEDKRFVSQRVECDWTHPA